MATTFLILIAYGIAASTILRGSGRGAPYHSRRRTPRHSAAAAEPADTRARSRAWHASVAAPPPRSRADPGGRGAAGRGQGRAGDGRARRYGDKARRARRSRKDRSRLYQFGLVSPAGAGDGSRLSRRLSAGRAEPGGKRHVRAGGGAGAAAARCRLRALADRSGFRDRGAFHSGRTDGRGASGRLAIGRREGQASAAAGGVGRRNLYPLSPAARARSLVVHPLSP